MSQDNTNRTRSSHKLLFGEPIRIRPGPPPPARPAAAPTPTPVDQGLPIPAITVTPPLSLYRPASEVYPGPPSVMQAAWAMAPKPRSFADAINIVKDIRENAYNNPANYGPQSAPMNMPPPATVPKPDLITNITAPRPQQAAPVFRTLPATAANPVTKPVAPTDQNAVTMFRPKPAVAAAPVTQPVRKTTQHAVTVFRPKPAIATGLVAQRVGQSVPSGSSSNTSSSGHSPPHLGSGLSNSNSAGPSSLVHPGNFIGPALPPNHPDAGISGPTSPHLGSGLATAIDAELASAMRLAHVLRSSARPDYLRPYNEPGFYGTVLLEPRNRNVGFEGQPSHQAPPHDQRAATYVPQPQTKFIGFGDGPSTQPAGYEEPAPSGSQSMQPGQSASTKGYLQPTSSSGGRQARLKSPAPPTERSGSTASADVRRAQFEKRQTYWPDSPERAELVAKVEHADNMTAISGLRANIRRQQLHNKDLAHLHREKERIMEESLRLKKDEERFHHEDEIQWHQLERRESKQAHRN